MKKKILAYFLYYSGTCWLKLLWIRVFGSRKLRILAYHRVIDIDPENFYFADDVVDATTSDFDKQMRFVSRYFNVITFSDLAEYQNKGRFPKNILIITFDDGYRDNYTNAYPILRRYGLPATIFLATGYIETNNLFWWDRLAYIIKKTTKKEVAISINGQNYKNELSTYGERLQAIMDITSLLKKVRNDEIEDTLIQLESSLSVTVNSSIAKDLMLSWDDIKKMSQNGIEFGAHTEWHPILTNLSLDEVKNEILSSKKEIERRISKGVKVFAHPSGLYNDNCLIALKEIGIKFGFSYLKGLSDLYKHPYELSRMSIDLNQGMAMFKARLCFPRLMLSRTKGS